VRLMSANGDKNKEIENVRLEEQRVPAKWSAAGKARARKIFSEKALGVIRANDARAFAELLRDAGVTEDSMEWRRAWEYFRSQAGKS